MTASRGRLVIASAVLAALAGSAALEDNNGGSWWPRWGMGGGMRGGWEADGGMMAYGPDTASTDDWHS